MNESNGGGPPNSLAAADARPFAGPALPRLVFRDATRRATGLFRPRAG